MLAKRLVGLSFALLITAAHAQSPWQGEWGAFTDAKNFFGHRLSVSACTATACQFSIESATPTGRISTASDATLNIASDTSAAAKLNGGDHDQPCLLQLTRQTSPSSAIVIVATGSSCLSYYGTGMNVTLSGTYPQRSTTPYASSHRNECYSDDSPARLAICTSPKLAELENNWHELADEYPLHPPIGRDQTSYQIAEQQDLDLLSACDKAPEPAKCLADRYNSDIASLQARKNMYLDGTTQRGDPTAGHALALKIAGRYRHTFANGNVQGDHYRSTDTLTMTPVGAASISFDIELNFYNGHTCSLNGGALFRKDGSFVFDDDPTNKIEDEPLCRLAIIPTANGVTFKDITGGCHMYCGARGTLDGAGFTFSERVAVKK